MRILPLFAALATAHAQAPRTWTQSAVDSFELPLASPKHSPVHIGEEAYYRIPERVIYQTYPVYTPQREPAGYMNWLKTRQPEAAFDASRLNTQKQWIEAGALVFNAPTSFNPVFFTAENLRDPDFYKHAGMPIANDGTIPFARWVIRKSGTVELGSMGCNTCHTRVLGDGTVVPGAQGNNANDRQGAMLLRASVGVMGEEKAFGRVRAFARQFELPWAPDDINRLARSMALEDLIAAGEAIPPGVTARANTSMFLPPQIPDLIGVRERRYLDHTGLVRQREIGDLMRYSSLAQDMFSQDRYDEVAAKDVTPPAVRYSDAQLHALALYLYSLKPPANPNRFDGTAARGKALFANEGCGNCHTAPLYTNNKLVSADGFEPPHDSEITADIVPARIGIDSRYTLQTRKGTGYYKIPSLKGVWYRGPFGHNGPAATLEEWFDPARIGSGYIPGGFKGFDGKTRSIPGHRFGLMLSEADRHDLIAFLRTL